ncbi:MAG: FAD-binding protein [Proteobacteria bacterium]|nr:FAD-binding protein [Pseudomonadota bacterium]
MKRLRTDILILGSGGAGLLAALHANKNAPQLSVTIVVKGLLGKCGCTRMVQGGYNVALAQGDSVERHFMDTVEGGKWLNDQELAWQLVTGAQTCIRELENEFGCFFDRNADGTVHQKAFAGQTFDRTVHKGDLTGIEIVNRLAEQLWVRDINRLEDYRAVEIIKDPSGEFVAGVLLIDMRTGEFVFMQAKAVLLATGGGPTMYKYNTPSADKSCDGLAMALHAGLGLRDLEMVQFHPTGLLAGPDTRMTGTVLEEGLRGAGGYLLDGNGERFMQKYDPRGERATRDIVSRAMYEEIRAGNTSPLGGLFLQMSHLGSDDVRKMFKGMVERCEDCGFDLAGGRVEVIPTAHYMMGGVLVNADCSTTLSGMFAAGEDTGGVHGANRLGGNGVANATVFGSIAGRTMAQWVADSGVFQPADEDVIMASMQRCRRPLNRTPGDLNTLRERLYDITWDEVGIVREAQGLRHAETVLCELDRELDNTGVVRSTLALNLAWHDWLDLKNLVLVSRAITTAAIARQNSRGAHYRSDFPETGDLSTSTFTHTVLESEDLVVNNRPVHFTRVQPGQTVVT